MTLLLSQRAQWILLGIMMALMALTRYNHFFTPTLLADVTWAAFFVAGLMITYRFAPIILILEVLLIDLGGQWLFEVDIETAGCISPAYPFLLLAYMSLWAAGRLTQTKWQNHWTSLVKLYTLLVIGVSVAFAISNLSYFAFADTVELLDFSQFVERVTPYWSSFLQAALFWVTTIIVTAYALIKASTTHRHTLKNQAN